MNSCDLKVVIEAICLDYIGVKKWHKCRNADGSVDWDKIHGKIRKKIKFEAKKFKRDYLSKGMRSNDNND